MELSDKLFDRLFRIIILVISIAFLIIYYEGTQNERYKYYHSDAILMIDGKTGQIYHFNRTNKEWTFIDPIASASNRK